jgi:hypothetical protein
MDADVLSDRIDVSRGSVEVKANYPIEAQLTGWSGIVERRS